MLKLSDYSQLSEASLAKALAAGHLWYTWGYGRFAKQCRRDMRPHNLLRFWRQGRLFYGDGR